MSRAATGLAAWIVEKFRTWSDCGGRVESRFSKDELLTNVSLYWFNQNITSSTRLYYEAMGPFAKEKYRSLGKVKVGWQEPLHCCPRRQQKRREVMTLIQIEPLTMGGH